MSTPPKEAVGRGAGSTCTDRSQRSLGLPKLDIFDAVRGPSLAILGLLVRRWLPDGRQRGSEWVARNPTRSDRHAGSFSVNLTTGRWADFATGDCGGDPISLAAYLFGLSQAEAACELARTLGIDP